MPTVDMPAGPSPRRATTQLPNSALASGLARRWLGYAFPELAGSDVAYDAQVLLAELVTNSHRHTDSPTIDVTGVLDGGLLQLEVVDDGSSESIPQLGNDRDDGGRGLGQVVEAYATEWGVVLEPNQTRVWATLKIETP